MRKALIGIILAATVLTPVAANAQRGHRGERGERSWSSSNDGDSNRSERAQARREAREARQSQPQQQVQQPQPQPQVARRGGGDGQRRSWNGGGNGDGQRGSWNRGGNDDGNRGSRGGGGGDRGGRRGGGDQPSVYPQAWQGNPDDPRLQHYRNLERRNQAGGDTRRGDRDGRTWRGDRDGRNDRNWRGDRDGRRNWRNDWNRGWRNDNRYNWSFWRGRNRHIFNLSPYYSPYRNWSYRRFSIGLFLDSLFYSQRYWIGDPYQYRLPAAPYGTQWVRYYNDVLLVDIYTGEVIDVIYDFFW